MARLRVLQDMLLTKVADGLRSSGFRRKKQGFRRVTPWGWQEIHVSFAPHSRGLTIAVDAGIRHDAIENLVNEGARFPTPRLAAQTATLGNDLGYLSVGRPLSWAVHDESDIPTVCAGILDVATSVGLPFFARFSSLEDFAEVLSDVGQVGQLHYPLDDIRGKKALAAAFLLGRRDTFHRLVETYRRYLEQNENAFGLEQFVPFAEKLAGRWSEGSGESGAEARTPTDSTPRGLAIGPSPLSQDSRARSPDGA